MSNIISSSTKQLDKNLAAADLHTDVNTRSHIKISKVETLAKLYLGSEPAQIDDATLVELCDWLWSEFQATPLNLEFSWYERYQNATEMFADIKQSHLWVSAENYDTSLGINPIYNFILYAVHNHDHYRTHSDFSGDSPESAEIFQSGLTLAEKYGAQISILHVLNLFQSGFDTVSNPFMGGTYPMMNDLVIQEYQKELQDRAKQGIEQLESYATEARARNITAEIFQNMGDPGRTICETAKNYSADLIVIGRNQRSVLSEIFLGSTSNYVLHHAPCSVMVIQQK
jgi:nucleotide-binding universal stress UspA family protein